MVALTETRRELLLAKTEDYNAQGFRVLLIATRKLDGSGNNPTLSVEDETELTIEGMLTFLDPPKAPEKLLPRCGITAWRSKSSPAIIRL